MMCFEMFRNFRQCNIVVGLGVVLAFVVAKCATHFACLCDCMT